MDLYINDLSFDPNHIPADNHNILLDFLDVCDKTQSYLFEKIFVPDGHLHMDIVKDISFSNCFHKIVGKDDEENKIHFRIKSILANRFKISSNTDSDYPLHWIEWKSRASDLLRSSYDQSSPAISFKTNNDFEQAKINVEKVSLDADAIESRSDEVILNLGDISHFEIHKEHLVALQLEQAKLKGRWDALHEPIRFKEIIVQYLEEIKFKEKFKKLESNAVENIKAKKIDTNERVALAIEVGRAIAERTGWMYNRHLSKINERTVFKALNQTVYLAIDTETVSFELHNRFGDHKGEYNFEGEKIEDGKGHRLKLD